MDRQEGLDRLHASLRLRETPETVVETILALLPDDADPSLRRHLSKVVEAFQSRHYWSSMPTEFKGPVPMDRQVAKAVELADAFLGSKVPLDDPDGLEDFIAAFSALIGRKPGQSDFRTDRLGREDRAALGASLSRRRYTKLFRLAGRLEDRLARLRREESKFRMVLVGKAALAPDLTPEQLGGHLPTAGFVAYYAARMKMRSQFTIQGQTPPFDEIAEALLRQCEADGDTRWEAVAHVFPRADVLSRLDDEAKGRLAGRWFGILHETAGLLEDISTRTKIVIQRMVVCRGNDSTTWNLLAGAWNRSRDNWIAVATALGMDSVLDAMLPGKVMRLMAGDVAHWHASKGSDIHPDTLVWADLPKPWEVLLGEVSCTRAQVIEVCERYEVHPEKSGWVAPRSRTAVSKFTPTPELVHGVTVENSHLAHAMRRLGYFSGKPLRVGHLS